MAGDERRAEVEAARTSWVCDACGWSATFDEPMTTVYCVACLHEGLGRDVRCRLTFPLDRVRDARGDDEVVPLSAEDDERHARWEFEQSRSPQGEDHETQAVAALYEFARERWGWGSEEYESVRDAVAVVLARVSPSRDGTVEREALAAEMRKVANHDPNTDMHWLPLTTVEHVLREFRPSELGQESSRDGTVAVEDVRAQTVAEVAAFIRDATAAEIPDWHGRGQDGVADAIQRKFARSATGEQTDHGGDQ